MFPLRPLLSSRKSRICRFRHDFVFCRQGCIDMRAAVLIRCGQRQTFSAASGFAENINNLFHHSETGSSPLMSAGSVAAVHVAEFWWGVSGVRPIAVSIMVFSRGKSATVLASFIFEAPRCFSSEVEDFVSWINTRIMVAILMLSSEYPAS
jgi:hypothetical protein